VRQLVCDFVVCRAIVREGWKLQYLGSVETVDYTLRDFSNLFRSAANMSVFVVIRGIRTPTIAGSSIIGGKGCDVTFLE
jgi:hypothetical protein